MPHLLKTVITFSSAFIFTVIWLGYLFPTHLIEALNIYFSYPPVFIGYVIIFLRFLIPLSCLIAVLCIWISYYYEKINLMYCSNLIPIMTYIAVVKVHQLLFDLAWFLGN